MTAQRSLRSSKPGKIERGGYATVVRAEVLTYASTLWLGPKRRGLDTRGGTGQS